MFRVMLAVSMTGPVGERNEAKKPSPRPIARAEQRSVKALRPEHLDTDLLELGSRKTHQPRRVGVSRKGMVATAHYHATEAGAEMLADGGNAVDAAVAAACA